MSTKILAITHRNFSHLYHEALELLHLPLELELLEVNFGELHKIDYEIFSEYDLIITSGAHLGMINKDYHELTYLTPIYPLHITEADIVNGLVKAKQYGNKITLLYSSNEKHNIEQYEKILGVTIKNEDFGDLKEVENLMKTNYKNGFNVVLGSSSICEIAEDLGIKNVLLYSRDSLKLEIIKAYQFATTKNKMLRYAKIQDAVLQHASNPVFLIDHNHIILDTNPGGLRYLGKKAKHEIIGDHISNLMDIDISSTKGNAVILDGNQDEILFKSINNTGSKKVHLVIVKKYGSLADSDGIDKKINLSPKYKFSNIVHSSKEMKKVILKAKQYAQTDAPILIFGESGTGKELFAHSIHQQSERHSQPFLPVNCAAIPKEILESELFGYEHGAFTGAVKGGKPGYFEMAQNGTIFLDEIGEIPIELQTRLLRVLQEQEVIRLGGKKIIPLNVRIITATNKPLDKLVQNNAFREDLFYRINVLRINVPSVRGIKEDIPLILNHLLIKYGIESQQANYLIDLAKESLIAYDWPGNVREMENFAQRFSALKSISNTPLDLARTFTEVFSEFIELKMNNSDIENQKLEGDVTYPELEKLKIINVLLETKGNKNQAAEKLGISRTTLWRKIKEYKISNNALG